MKRNQIYQLILFIFLIIIIDQSIGNIINHFARKYKYDRRIELLIENKLDQDIIILGSSRALNGIDPETIEKETSLSCYNLAMSGSNVLFHETMLDLILLSKHHPKTIIYNIDDPGTLENFNEQVIYRKEELYPYIYTNAINKIVAEKLDKKIWATKISATYRYNVNFITAIKYIFRGSEKPSYEINNIDKNGANLMVGHQIGNENMKYKNPIYKFNNAYIPYSNSFLSIIDKCKKAEINLILVYSPTYFIPTIGFKEKIKQLNNNNCIILDYSKEFTENNLFYNYGHLNKKGAIKFSKLISNQIIEN